MIREIISTLGCMFAATFLIAFWAAFTIYLIWLM